MIYKRFAANLRAQNWFAIGIEFAIVVAGVFVGTQVSNWNQERIEQRETERMLANLKPELEGQLKYFADVRAYYGVTRKYAEQALAAWSGSSSVGDREFVIAAYQASQITGLGTNAENWALTFGGDQLRNINDPQVRRNLEVILSSDYGPISLNAAASQYREQVRHVIPIAVQDAIRNACGDRIRPEALGFVRITLPDTCPVKISPADSANVAAALRARPELARELNWHLATVAVVMTNVDILERPVRELHQALAAPSSKSINAG